MLQAESCCRISYGKIYLADYGGNLSYGYNYGLSYGKASDAVLVADYQGNASNFEINREVRVLKQQQIVGNTQQTICSGFIVDNMTVNMTFSCDDFSKVQSYLYAKSSRVYPEDPTESVIIMPKNNNTFCKGSFYTFGHIGLDSSKVILERTDTMMVYAQGIYYEVTKLGIKFLSDISLPAGVGFKVTYGYDLSKRYDCHEAFIEQPPYKTLVFEAGNRLNPNEHRLVKIHKVRILPSNTTSYLGTDGIEQYVVEGEIEPDFSFEGSGNELSPWYSEKRYYEGGTPSC